MCRACCRTRPRARPGGAGTQGAAFEITELVEHEQRMIAGAGAMPVPDAHFLLAMGRAFTVSVNYEASSAELADKCRDELARSPALG
jgi:hypothetical protein